MSNNSIQKSTPIVLKVSGVKKKFCTRLKKSLFYGSIDLLRSLLGIRVDSSKLRSDEFWALKNINFDLKQGEVLGIIGMNGAGKSTLLRVLSGIFPPDSGYVEIHGNIGGLIALGAGFHPHFSGRENIYLNGTVLGMTRKEIDEKINSIIAFSELGPFIDSPVSTYSSGMYVRLGFAIAIHCEPDILLIDEVLSVGDASFQNKCLRKIAALKKKAKAVIFIGHNLDYIKILCDRAILMDKGQIIDEGNPNAVVAKYLALSREQSFNVDLTTVKIESDKDGLIYSDEFEFVRMYTTDENGNHKTTFFKGDTIAVSYEFIPKLDIEKSLMGIGFRELKTPQLNVTYDVNMDRADSNPIAFKKSRKYRITAKFKDTNFTPGVYRINLCFWNNDSYTLYHNASEIQQGYEVRFKNREPIDVTSILVQGNKFPYNSAVELETHWSYTEIGESP